jgi:ubiquinone/menaquinone biosynthesis C-methylase UbiE
MESFKRSKIRNYYGGIAKNVTANAKSSCCSGSSCCADNTETAELYDPEHIKGLPIEAINASLGCANPLVFADLKPGETVLDLGSGGGIDVLIASGYVGETGMVYGLDMTDEMLMLANQNKAKSGIENVAFIKGYIEDIPLGNETVDVITSNCVINLSESKEDAIKEAYRVLKPNGRLAIADIVQLKEVSDEIRQSIELWVGCISGALSLEEYKRILELAGFKSIEITPVSLYSKEMLKNVARSKKLDDMYKRLDEESLDGAYASAIVKAYK